MEFNLSEKETDQIINIPENLPVLPLRDVVIFPYMIYPVLIGREQSINAAKTAIESDKFIFLATQKNSAIDEPTKNDIYVHGTVAKIIQILKLPNGLLKILVDGLVQGKIENWLENKDYMYARISVVQPEFEEDHETSALLRQMTNLFQEYVKINRNVPSDAINSFNTINEPDRKLFYAAANLQQSITTKQTLLETTDLKEQLFELIKILRSEIDILKIEQEIDHKVQENIAKTQRRFIIQEQIKILQDELGEDVPTDEYNKIEALIKKAKMPKKVQEKAIEELSKLVKIPQMSPEYTVIKNYLDWMIALPWSKRSKDNLDINHVQNILDEDHFGLEKPKERIIEHIAVLNLVKNLRGQILCFAGPPGVGKTSLGKSIARALGREFVRISLGGVRDEAEIRGHRKTYIGSMPGKIIQAMKRAGTVNPVILLDEIDKLSSDFRGDPSSAMLEVLDPEQNNSFNDHYLEVDYDLSQVLFITTANVKYNIPLPLLDRMEVIELNGYLEHDKIEIAKRHLIPKQIKNNGLTDKNVGMDEDAIRKIITDYTREAGVRNLEREMASIFRKVAKEVVVAEYAKGKKKPLRGVGIDPAAIEKYLGVPKYKKQKVDTGKKIGSVIGLAWTSVGGDILRVEVSVMPGKERLTLTGQLGNVMKESAQAALSYIRSNYSLFGLSQDFFRDKEIHIHLPEGAIPKDGPSAGITMTMAMISALTGKEAANDVAMTGEITLRGDVLAIGGLTEKLLAAQRNLMTTVIIPKDNEPDLREINAKVLKGLTIVPVLKAEEAVPYLFPGTEFGVKSTPEKRNGKAAAKTKKEAPVG
ncbi:MAG: endopeptidase La [Ignavibacteriaceae bacterium]|nr:endopeptidase La [Ignavibacteriaceae bacterium]